MKRVLLRGPFLTNSGYGVHARQVARWALSKTDWDVKIQTLSWGITPWLIDSNDENGLIGQIMSRTASLENVPIFDLSIQIQLPNEWDPRLARVNIGVTAAVETDRCNPDWIGACNRMTAVVVPSQHTKSVLESTGKLTVPILVVPESYYDELTEDTDQKFSHDFSTKFNFLVFGQLTGNNPENDRKNLFYTLKWMFEEFKDDKDVGVILKTNSGRQTKIDKLMTEKFVKQLVKEVRKTPYPKVHLLHGKMDNREISSLMRDPTVKALVSLTRGEGYGLPTLEAATSGLPVIATNWSGHLDFLKSDFIAVDYTLVEIHPSRVDNKIFMKGTKWANPSESDAKKKLRKFYEKSTMPRHKAQEAAKRIRHDYSFSSICKIYDEKLTPYI
jgi:glycosyltransferase involved in cell wall biosynthesis